MYRLLRRYVQWRVGLVWCLVAVFGYPLIYIIPGAALLLFVLAWNLIGDAFRDALDPKMRGYRAG